MLLGKTILVLARHVIRYGAETQKRIREYLRLHVVVTVLDMMGRNKHMIIRS